MPSVHLVGHSTDKADYIKDGLVFWLDGIDKGGEDVKWVDLVGGVEFTPNGEVEWGKNYVKGRLDALIPVIYPIQTSTIEVAVTYDTKGLFFNSGSLSGICSGVVSNNLLITHDSSIRIGYRDAALLIAGIHTISANSNLMLHNFRAQQIRIDSDQWNLRSSVAILNPNRFSSVTFHSIRIYDRLLTEAEMRHNQEVDRRRFKLTLPEPIMTLEYEEEDYEGYDEEVLRGEGQ